MLISIIHRNLYLIHEIQSTAEISVFFLYNIAAFLEHRKEINNMKL